MECYNCQSLCVASCIIEGKNTKYKKRYIKIIGSLIYYSIRFKKFIKKCCLIKYYLGHYNTNFINVLFDVINVKQEKYINIDDEIIPVYEIKFSSKELLNKDPFSFPEINNKLEITRKINWISSSNNYYQIMPSEVEKTKKENNIMEIDLAPLNDSYIGNSIMNYIYIIKDRTSVELNKNIYKIGKTKQDNLNRFKGYPKGFKIVFIIACSNCDLIEKNLINMFKQKYIQIKEYGNEYFQGNVEMMIKDIVSLVI